MDSSLECGAFFPMIERYLLTLEFPINEGYIWVELREKEISSAPVALCIECGDFKYCESGDCLNCQYTKPEMIERRKRIDKIYEEISPSLEDLVIEFKNRIEIELEKISNNTSS